MNRILFAIGAFCAVSATAASDPTYVALRAARPDGRTIAVNNLAIDRDVYHITLTGTLNLLSPVEGATVGAVFVGKGDYTLTPASDDEAQALRINSGEEKLTALTDSFDSAVFFDAPLITAADAAAGAPHAGAPSSEAVKQF